jgi:hypothetical protein
MTTLGSVTSEENIKDAQLFRMPIPTEDSTAQVMLDLFGTYRTIRIKGVYTGDVADVKTFIQKLDTLCNGKQTPQVYHSDKGYGSDGAGNYNVLIDSVSWMGEEGVPNKVDYEINMTEGSA